MSDGMSDSRALGRLSGEVQSAAFALFEALHNAEQGHRGWAIDVLTTVNEILEPLGYRLQRKSQDERWE